MLSRKTTLLSSAAVLACAAAAAGQDWDLAPRNGACFYEDVNYGGDHFCVRTGERLEAMPRGLEDKVSSIRTFGRAEVTIYRDHSFAGGAMQVRDDVPDLRRGNWNDKVSSLQVRSTSAVHRGQAPDDGDFGDARTANRIVRRAYRDVLGRSPDAEELQRYRSRVVEDSWSEADIREALRSSGDYTRRDDDSREYGSRYGMSQEQAESIVRRAYRNVLDREPDAASDGYVEHVLRDGWSQRDVERDLRRSLEYRNRNR